MKSRRGLWFSLAAVALFLVVGRALASAYADYRWYTAMGATDVWRLRFGSETLLRGLAFLVGTSIAFANLWAVRHSVVSLVLPRRLANVEIGEEVPGRLLFGIALALAVALGIAFALPAKDWRGFELAWHGIPFGDADPYFHLDVGFFVYWLPFERSAYSWFVSVVSVVIAIAIGMYALTPSLRWQRGRIHVSTYVRRHVAILGGVVLALLAWSFRLDAYTPLIAGSGPDGAFGAFDHQMGVPISMILAYAAIGSAFVVAWAGWTGQSRIAVAVMTVLLLLTPTMEYLLPLAVRWASAPVDPAVRELPYAADRNGFTRSAYGLQHITRMPARDAWPSARDATNISVWDPPVLARAISRSRRRGAIAGTPNLIMSPAGPVFLSVEQPSAGDTAASGWTIVRSLAAITDERGSLVRVDEQGRFPLEDQIVGRVLSYPGARGALVVTDTIGRLAAPAMESFGARLAEAWSQQNFRLLSSPTTGARMMRLRDVHERLRALVPFFTASSRVIPVVHGDSLLWSVELYSTTLEYPLSRRMVHGTVGYLRHAATALVHANTGRVTILTDEDPGPVARTWMRQLPVTLKTKQAIAPSLLALLPPDVDGTLVQAEAFAAVGSRDEATITRHTPVPDGSDTLVASPEPTLVWSPAAGASAWLLPLVDDRDRVSGIMVATGGAHRSVRWFSLADTTTNWSALVDRLQRAAAGDEGIAREPRAAGRIRLVPMSDGRPLALQPFYGWPVDEPPYVSRVVMVIGDTAAAAPSVAAVVGAPVTAGPQPATPDAKAQRLRTLYAEMRAALQKGDWRAFGAAFDALGALLGRQ